MWMNIPAAAEYAGVSRSTIGRWMDDGMVYHRLNHNNVRIHPDDVDAFIRRFKVGDVGAMTNELSAMLPVVQEVVAGK